MNPLKTIYCSRYFDLKKQRKEHTARVSGTIVTSILFFLLFLSTFLLMIVYYSGFEGGSTKFLNAFFGKSTVKGISKLILVLFFGIVYSLIKYTIGSVTSYNKIIEEFSLLNQYEQERVKKTGTIYFLSPILIFIISMTILMIKT